MLIPFIDLNSQYKSIKTSVDSAIEKVLKDSHFVGGQEVGLFEAEFVKYLGAKYCISVNSGTDALILGMRGLNLKSGDEVIVPTFTFVATALSVSENNLKPIFVDVDENDYGINLDDLKKKITHRTKAIILVHLYGQPDKIDEVKEIIKKTGRKIYLIEDAAQAHGAEYKGKKVGTFGVFSAFSFYPTKNLGAYGDGGAIVTNDAKLAHQYRLLKEYGQKKKYFYQSFGINSRLDTLQAAILRVKLKCLDHWNAARRNLAHYYTDTLKQNNVSVITPKEYSGRKNIYHVYAIRSKRRNQLQEYLKKNLIATIIHYPSSIHRQIPYLHYLNHQRRLPIAEKISSEILSLPIYPELTTSMIDYIVKRINNFFEMKA